VTATAAGPETLPADQLYGRLLATVVEHVFAGGPEPPRARVRSWNGGCAPLPLERWVAAADAVDAAVLAGLRGPVLDIGCGPGRHVAALSAAGVDALGVDLSPIAVQVTRGRGGAAIGGSVFADVPRAGRWRGALLLDGNIGIGGDPAQLLRRVRDLLAPGGAALVELDPPGAPSERTRVRLEAPGLVSEWFAWARVGVDGVAVLARGAGLQADPAGQVGARWFARLRRP
jgi:SAM-dependent methyltransferase